MPWQPPPRKKGRTLALVAGLHLLLGLGLVKGLGVDPLQRVEDSLTALDISQPLPELDPQPATPDESAPAPKEEGAQDLAALPASTVVPPVRELPTSNPLLTADETAPVTAAAPSAGASPLPGEGRGAGSEGQGIGGGGSGGLGDGAGSGLGQEARLLSGNLGRRDYRRIRSFGSPRGSAVLAIEVGADGRLTSCLPVTGSGNPALDAELCLLLQRTRWEPARDRAGRPVPVTLRYVANWDRD